MGSGKFIIDSISMLVAPDATFLALCLFMNCLISSSPATSSSSTTLGEALLDLEIGVAGISLVDEEEGILEAGRESLEVRVRAGEGATRLGRSRVLVENELWIEGFRTERLSRTTFLAAAETVRAADDDDGGTGS